MLITGGEGNEEKDTGTRNDSSNGIFCPDLMRIDRISACHEGRDDYGCGEKGDRGCDGGGFRE